MQWFIISLAVLVVYTQARSALRPPFECGPVCAIYCPHGNVMDDRGCPTCRCNDEPYPCPMFKCLVPCDYGHVTDSRGCMTCRCKPGPFPPLPIKRECPAGSKSNIQCPFALPHECETDNDCSSRKKCCMYGCSKRCVYPRPRDYFPYVMPRIEDPFV